MVRVAVLGASKGCARAMVTQSLNCGAGHSFKLLIRNPDSLNDTYTKEQLSEISIIKGDALDIQAVKETIKDTDVVVFSVGSAFDLKKRKMIQPGLCASAMGVLLQSMQELSASLSAPADASNTISTAPKRLVVVSTTGLDGMKEVPLLFQPLYKFLLHEPHMDKLAMEKLVEGNSIQGLKWVIVRPSLLTDGDRKGKYKADVGISGYTISREDVGHFLLNQCITPETPWVGKKVVVTN